MKLTQLQTLSMYNPLGIDRTPYFSWILESEEKDTLQTASRLRVIHDSTGECVWDSGRMEGRETAFVPYGGPALLSRTPYRWTVEAEDNHGNTASAEASFETALLHSGDWMTAWAESTLPVPKRQKGFGKQAPATFFRKSFQLEELPERARLYVTCRGIYRLTVNGHRLDERELAPEYTVYDKYLCYQTYDAAPFLEKGENVIGMIVADGWYFCPSTTILKKTESGHHAVVFQLELGMTDGRGDLVTSFGNVRTSCGPFLSADLFAGEQYDARRELTGWDRPGYDDSTWKEAKPVSLGFSQLRAQLGQGVLPVRQIPAVRAYVSPRGEHIVDFGENLAGRVRMHVKAASGTVITLKHFEVTDSAGNFTDTIIGAGGVGGGVDQMVEYTANGEETDFEESFSYQGFRYVMVQGLGEIKAEDFTAIVLESGNENIGSFSCSSEDLNRLYANIRRSQRANFISIPTDCPQREKAGWTGDIGIYAKTALLNEDVTAFLTRWLDNLKADQAENGAVPIVVPFNQQYRTTSKFTGMLSGCLGDYGVSGWGDAAVLVPWAMYQMTGNREILKAQYDSMKSWCGYIRKAAEKTGDKHLPKDAERYLWNTGFQYGEWLIPSTAKNGFDFKNMGSVMKETAAYSAPAYSYYSLALTARTARLLGCEEDALELETAAEKVKSAIRECLIGQDGSVPSERMGAYVILLYFGLIPEEKRLAAAEQLTKLIHENGDCLDTGFLATPFLLDVLMDNGQEELAWTLLTQTKAPSWLYEVQHGATTIWESWYGYKEDGEPAAISMNHYAFGCVADWMFRTINGIQALAPGFRRIRIAPRPGAGITGAARDFRSTAGMIHTDWSLKDDLFLLNVSIPANAEAVVELPDGSSREVGSGSYTFSCRI